jgi:hypothetical protein
MRGQATANGSLSNGNFAYLRTSSSAPCANDASLRSVSSNGPSTVNVYASIYFLFGQQSAQSLNSSFSACYKRSSALFLSPITPLPIQRLSGQWPLLLWNAASTFLVKHLQKIKAIFWGLRAFENYGVLYSSNGNPPVNSFNSTSNLCFHCPSI